MNAGGTKYKYAWLRIHFHFVFEPSIKGICNAWLWPLDGARHCLAWRPVPLQGTSTFGADRLGQELLWIGVPLLLANAGMARAAARWRWTRTAQHSGSRAQRQRRVTGLRSLVEHVSAQHQWRQALSAFL